jgi:hypothetical protein
MKPTAMMAIPRMFSAGRGIDTLDAWPALRRRFLFHAAIRRTQARNPHRLLL